MRGVHSAVDDIRRNVFTEVARLAYGGEDYNQVDMIPYKLIPGEVAHHRHDVFLERAIISARIKLALGMDLNPNGPSAPISAEIQKAATDQKYFNEPLVNIIPYACNACPPKQIRITDSCQGCISHPCMNVCPRDAIYLDEHKHCHIDQSKCIKCGKCFNQCPYRAISKIERPCAAKKLEANRKSVRSDVDFVLTFEELQGMFDAKDINFAEIETDPADSMDEGTGFGRGFAVGGGVAAAVVEAIKHIDPSREIQIEYGDGLRECKKMLMMAKAGKRNGYLLEGMGCPGGCVAGAGTIRPVKESVVRVQRYQNTAQEQSALESRFQDRLDEVYD